MKDVMERIQTTAGNRIGGRPDAVPSDLAYLTIGVVNVCLFGRPGAPNGGWVLIDAGLPGSASRIRRAAHEWIGPWARPSAIVLTHGHFDHVGALRTGRAVGCPGVRSSSGTPRTCPAAPPTRLPIPPWVAEPCLHSPASILVAPSIWGGGSVLYRMTARYPECRDGDGLLPRGTRRATFRSSGRPTGP